MKFPVRVRIEKNQKNVLRKLLMRETSRKGNVSFRRNTNVEKFRSFHMQVICSCRRT